MVSRLSVIATESASVRRNARDPVPLQRIMPTDLERLPDPAAAARRLPSGSAVILRDAGHPLRDEWALRLRAVTADLGHMLLVANDPILARLCSADGLHLAERDVGRVSPFGFTTAAAHSLEAVRRAEKAGVQALLLSPVFPTASHPGGPALGLQRARAIASAARLPVYGMGGVSEHNSILLGRAFAGFAAIGAYA
jgi:thiamine-phosphate pyrophosphorylase